MTALFGFLGSMFIIGSIGFYLLFTVEFALLCYFYHIVEKDDEPMTWPSSIALFIGSILLWWCGDFNVWVWAWSNKLLAGLGIGAYFGVGFIIALLAYGFRSKEFKSRLPEMNKKYNEYIDKLDEYTIKGDNYMTFARWVSNNYSDRDARMLKLSDLRNWIIYWIAFYPIGLLYKIVVKGIRGIAAWIYDNILIGIFKFFHEKIAQFEESADQEADIKIKQRLHQMKETEDN